MNYELHYKKLIYKAQSRSILKSEYKEIHHIIPKCLGGSNDKSNLVVLFPEEHLIAHLLLSKIYPDNNKLIHAAHMMTNMRRVNNKKYSWVKKKFSINHPSKTKEFRIRASLLITGDNNPAKREDVKEKMRKPKSEVGKENIQLAQKNKKKLFGVDNPFYGKKHSVEIAEKAVQNRKNNNGGNYHPDGNRTAKTFKFISPNGEEFIVFNSAKKFADEHNINFKLISKNRGVRYTLPPKSYRASDIARNSVGWTVIEILD